VSEDVDMFLFFGPLWCRPFFLVDSHRIVATSVAITYATFRVTKIDHGKGDGSRDLPGTCKCNPARTFGDRGSGTLVLIAHGIANAIV
jgi:hypothetical protein